MEERKRKGNDEVQRRELEEEDDTVDFVLDELEVSDSEDEEERRCAALLAARKNSRTEDLISEFGDLEQDVIFLHQQTSTNQHHDLPHSHTEGILPHQESPPLFHNKKVINVSRCEQGGSTGLEAAEKGHVTYSPNTMHTLKNTGRANQDVKRGTRGLCLPSLSNNNRQSCGDTGLSTGLLNTRTPCQPVPPRPRQRTRSVVDASPPSHNLLSASEFSQLSQSAPSIMEPLLCSNTMMQARANIQTRLGSQSTLNEQKGSFSVLRSRTPKHLAPLDGRPSKALPVLQPHIPLKPISPLCTRTQMRRERLSWDSPCNDRPINKAGSEGSGSSSLSSLNLKNEDDDKIIQVNAQKDKKLKLFLDGSLQQLKDVTSSEEDFSGITTPHFKVRPTISPVLLADRAKHGRGREHPLCKEKAKSFVAKINHSRESFNSESSEYAQKETLVSVDTDHFTSAVSDGKRSVDCTSEINHGNIFHLNDLQNDAVAWSETKSKRANSYHKTSAVDSMLNTSTAEGMTGLFSAESKMKKKTLNALKPARNKERRTNKKSALRANNQTKKSFNILGYKDQNNFKTNLKSSEVSSNINKIRESPGLTATTDKTFTKVKLKVKSVSAPCFKTDTQTPHKVFELQSNETHQSTSVKELKSAKQSKIPCLVGKKPRSQSSVDLITYKDSFQQMQSGDEGKAMYEMFAGPVFENLRVSSSCGKPERRLQPAATKKRKKHHRVRHRPLKPGQNKMKRRSGEGVNVSAKSKIKPLSSGMLPQPAAVPRQAIHRTESSSRLGADVAPGKDDDDVSHKCGEEENEAHALSTIKEAISRYGSETLKADEESLTTPTSSIHVIYYRFMHEQKLALNVSTQNSKQVPEVTFSPGPQQPMINTWTSSSSSCHASVSSVYKKFLDEVGDGPLTDELLQCLAEELISLDEREVSTGSEEPEQRRKELNREEELISGQNTFTEVAPVETDDLNSALVVDNITWTKGEVLGRGAYGTVYCGLTSQGQLIAVKQVYLDSSDPDAAKREYSRLQGEVELLKTLRHMNIVGFLGTSLHQHAVSIFMEYIPGGSIASILHRFGPLPERVLALYTHQILEGVAYLHLNRVIHRDLKGNNVMLMPTGVIKLIDFGCARRLSCLNHTACNSGELLRSVHGTPYWMAPEVINESGYGRKSDIWSVGCTVFEMATCKPPLAHMDKIAALFYIGAQKGSMPALPDGFSDCARDFVKICLTSDQRLRPSAHQLLKHSFIPKKGHECKTSGTAWKEMWSPNGHV